MKNNSVIKVINKKSNFINLTILKFNYIEEVINIKGDDDGSIFNNMGSRWVVNDFGTVSVFIFLIKGQVAANTSYVDEGCYNGLTSLPILA